ncbi:helix-turn-helix transcriptional regulator [Paenibacillus sp. WQ 127069]|jgi:plasmid maintenance system antidote protein VapI|uniref:Helix-turn-helix transcriptional regulator n=1 Tax=Paenibacillus baimaensis TaxID=2982185 RepID=A0ABT2ULJ2_9BACL|nr:helix-turn-helix transcriptional regulator [Paenibacillus sp. WQ 127069]MCU6795525.1 helix-turn-helix transcriptional regulator [Paenibacillus sp. WQ 127069]
MKFELGRCLLQERLNESDMTLEELSRQLRYKPERILDYIDNQRVMPLKTAISIANSVGCNVQDLYELRPID